MSELYKRIESLCSDRGISITTMCKESSASRASLSDLKVGRKQSLSADTLSKIANFFGVTVDYLLTGSSTYAPQRTSNEENPWELELLDAFDGLSLGNQIEAVAQVQRIAASNENEPLINDNQELTEYLQMLKTRPECRMLFQLTKNATKEDVEAAVRIIEALRNK